MPCTCRDRLRSLSDADRERLEDKLTMKETDRLKALATPWPWRPFAYFGWLTSAMDDTLGTLLFASGVLTFIVSMVLLLFLVIWMFFVGWGWLPCLLFGLGLGASVRPLVQNARATEDRYRRSTAEKLRSDHWGS